MVRAQQLCVDVAAYPLIRMRKRVAIIGATAISALLLGSLIGPQKRFIWNRTNSAPIGLYGLKNDPLSYGDWVIVSAQSEQGIWAFEHGFIGPDWPLIKSVAGLPGNEICRDGQEVKINRTIAAKALLVDSRGRYLPVWSGCHVLKSGEVFLLNDHAHSLDGRYFGVTKAEDVDGVAVLLFELKR